MKRGDLSIEEQGSGGFAITRRGSKKVAAASVALSADELRWLVTAAGPATLVQHAPLPTAMDAARRREGCATAKKSP